MQELLNVKAAGTYSDHSALKGWTAIIFLNGINQLIFVMVKCGVPFEVRPELSYMLLRRAPASRG
jgi:hypothetical protein